MRRLSVSRTDSDALTTLNIYIEDPVAAEVMINGIYCKKIGELANGERKIFEITETQVKVFAILGNVSSDVCYDYYQLPEGETPVFLARPNMKIRSRMSRKKRIILTSASIVAGCLLLFAAYFLIASFIPTGEPKTFAQGDMCITLTDEFKKTEIDEWDSAYKSEDVLVGVLCEHFYQYPELKNYSPVQYANATIKNSGIDSTVERGPMTYFVFSQTNEKYGRTYQNFCYIYKTTRAFWVVQFCVPEELAPEYEETIHEWAKSVYFNE